MGYFFMSKKNPRNSGDDFKSNSAEAMICYLNYLY